MGGTRLAVNGCIRRDSDVTGHSDLLSTGNPHPVDTAYGRLLAHQDGIDHPVEQIHVFAVFIGLSRIVFGVFLGVSARTESSVPDRCKNHGNHTPVQRSTLKPGDHSFDHLGGVGVVLGRIVEDDPGRVKIFNLFP
ncbi:hypothetical protein ES703_81918 [subsurface metagenome]